jgi:outer membrane protein TolC
MMEWVAARVAPRLPGGLLVAILLGATLTPAATAQGVEQVGAGLTLGEAVRVALDRSPRIEAARYNLEEAEEQVSEAWGNVYPQVDFTADYTRNVSPAVNFLPAIIFDPNAGPDEQIAVQFGADNIWQSLITLEQPLFDGRAFIGVGAASRYQTLQEEILRGEVQAVVSRVRTAYYEALLAQEETRLLTESEARVREALQETRALHRAGIATEYDVLRLEVELANLQPNVLRAENTARQARRNLAVELDVEAGTVEVEGSLATLNLVDPEANTPANREILALAGPVGAEAAEVDALVEQALRTRTDIRQLEVTEELRNAELRAQQSEYLPRVTLFGNYAINASQNGPPEFFGEPRAYARRVGVRVSVPIFQGFAQTARVDQRRATLRSARSQIRFAQNRAESDVRSFAEQVEEARQRAEAQGRGVEQAERGFTIARAQFREGLGSRLELTDAEVALRQSEFNYARAVYDYLTARGRLEEATGLVPVSSAEMTP